MKLALIVAMSRDRVIGNNKSIPWHLPEDMAHFKQITVGSTVIMGRTTWESIPTKYRPLAGRTNIIVSTTLAQQPGARVVRSVEAALTEAKKIKKTDAFCIGGAQLYAAMLPLVTELHVSWVSGKYQGDTFFPEIDWNEWREVETKEFRGFSYKKYERIKKKAPKK